MSRRFLIVLALVVAASIGGLWLAVDTAVDRAVKQAKKDTARELRVFARDLADQNRELLLNGCREAKKDRTKIALALRGQADYLNLVLAAASVQEDVKMAARVNQAKQQTAALRLEKRSGPAFFCSVAYPPLR